MLNIKNISVKNFMSVGNNAQGVRFDDKNLTLVLGNNLYEACGLVGSGRVLLLLGTSWHLAAHQPASGGKGVYR